MSASKKPPKVAIRGEAASRSPPSCNLIKQCVPDHHKINYVEVYKCKCKCRSVWCPTCYKSNHFPRIAEYLLTFKYKHTIVVTCTFDPCKCVVPGDPNEDSGSVSYQYLINKSPVSAFIDALKRRKQGPRLMIRHYIAFLEFHENGNPHYHLIIHFADDAYREHDLQKSWKHGEIDIRTFSSKGAYLDMFAYWRKDPVRYPDQAYQTIPPQDWLDKHPTIVRNPTSSNIRLGPERPKRNRSKGQSQEAPEKGAKPAMGYNKGLKKCGQETVFRTVLKNGDSAWDKLPIKYDDVTTLPGKYLDNKAYLLDDPDSILELLGRSQHRLIKK